MRIVYFGNNNRGIHILSHLVRLPYDTLCAISDPDFDQRQDWYRSVRATAEQLNVPVLSPTEINTDSFLQNVSQLQPDLFVLCGYSRILDKKLLNIPRLGAINLHAGKLPDYRGAAPLNWALINGEREIGISILAVDEGIDTGDILGQKTFGVCPDETIKDVAYKVCRLYCALLEEVLEKINRDQKISGRAQQPTEGFWYTKRYPEDGRILWSQQKALDVHNLVRALTRPYPGAFCFYKDKKVMVWSTRLTNTKYYGFSGRIAKRDKTSGSVMIVCKDMAIEITSCQVDGADTVPYDVFEDIRVSAE